MISCYLVKAFRIPPTFTKSLYKNYTRVYITGICLKRRVC